MVYSKVSLTRAASRIHCKFMKIQQSLLFELSEVPCFANNDCLVKPYVIDVGKLRKVHFSKFLRLSACFAAKLLRKVKCVK